MVPDKWIESAERMLTTLQARRVLFGLVDLPEREARDRIRALERLPNSAFQRMCAIENDDAREAHIQSITRGYQAEREMYGDDRDPETKMTEAERDAWFRHYSGHPGCPGRFKCPRFKVGERTPDRPSPTHDETSHHKDTRIVRICPMCKIRPIKNPDHEQCYECWRKQGGGR